MKLKLKLYYLIHLVIMIFIYERMKIQFTNLASIVKIYI